VSQGRWRNVVVVLAWGYPVVLLLVVAVLRFGSTRWWPAELALYLPRLPFAFPLPALIVLVLKMGRRRLLWTQLAALWILAFPLMGLVPPTFASRVSDHALSFTILSYNGNFASGGQGELLAQLREFDPDVVIFQQLFYTDQLTRELKPGYRSVQTDGEFFIASRFLIRSTTHADALAFRGRSRTPRFIRYEIETSLGVVALYNIHPISPRYEIAAARRGGLRHSLISGALTSHVLQTDIEADAGLRALQVRTFTQMAEHDNFPAIIAGDTNLPDLSPALADLAASFRDGFAEAGAGFGYTFPARWPWMRIDRIFANRRLRFLDFRVGRSVASDHLCVFAKLGL
jgi:vancomycin resistance protein VanJ